MTVAVSLSRGLFATIDDEDAACVSHFKWYATHCHRGHLIYSARNGFPGESSVVLLHRFILNAPLGVMVDHANRNGLDCRKENLRLCTRAQNRINSNNPTKNKFGFRGVFSSNIKTGTLRASIRVDGKLVHKGPFQEAAEAAAAYDELALKYYGEFAVLNFPPSDAH